MPATKKRWPGGGLLSRDAEAVAGSAALSGIRGLTHPEMIGHFRLGFANRTLGLPAAGKNRKAGADLRGRLQAAGHSAGIGPRALQRLGGDSRSSIAGRATCWACTGARSRRRPARRARRCTCICRGRIAACGTKKALQAASKEIILCESLIDALTFWCAGFRNVTASYGVNGFTDDHRAAFEKHASSACGSLTTATKPARKRRWNSRELLAMGIECFRVLFPKGDGRQRIRAEGDAGGEESRDAAESAQWLGKRSSAGEIENRSAAGARGEEPAQPAAKEENIPSFSARCSCQDWTFPPK
jgi:DNA primase